jgi:hypothetical protein
VLCLVGALLLVAGAANAAKVNLLGMVMVDDSAIETLKIEDGPTCNDFLAMAVAFGPRRTFAAGDDDGRVYEGRYKRKGAGDRTIIFKLDKASKRVMKKALKDFVRDCTGASKVSATIDSIKIKGKINRPGTALTVKTKVRGTGRADGDSGSATYSFKIRGLLEPF